MPARFSLIFSPGFRRDLEDLPASDRARLEQLCRYLLRPAVSQDRP